MKAVFFNQIFSRFFTIGTMASVLLLLPTAAMSWPSCDTAPNQCQTGNGYCYTAGAGSCSNRCQSDCPAGGNYTFTGEEFCPTHGDCGPLHRSCQCKLQNQTNPNCSDMYGTIFIGDGTNCSVKCRLYCGAFAGGCVQKDGEPKACVSGSNTVCACGDPNLFGFKQQ